MKQFDLSTQHLLLREMFQGAQEGMIITDDKARICACNDSFCRITGYEEAELLGQNPSILSSGKQDKAFYTRMWQCLQREGLWEGEVWNRRKDGSFFAELLSIRRISLPDSGETCYLGMMSDITTMKERHAALEKLAHYDSLTGLPNRNLLSDRFEQARVNCNRMHEMMAVCFLDLDDFKPVNDRYGHYAGDQVLIELARRVSQGIREGDTVSRYGGDEFVILLTELNSRRDCEQLLENLLQHISEPYDIEGERILIGASIGYTLYPLDSGSLETLINHADHTLYHVKNSGKQAISMFGELQRPDNTTQKGLTQAAVLAGLHADELRLFFQPQIDMASGTLIGFEALVRWQHPHKGLLSPVEFLPLINQSGIELRLGEWVIREALGQLQNWHNQGLQVHVSINLSPYHLGDRGFLDSLRGICAHFPGLDLRYFQIEILESHALDDISTINSVIAECRQELGITTALDDFGTGYSSLSHIRALPIKTLKIDQSFVSNMLNDTNDYKIVEGVIALAASFDISVIAEGVESLKHAEVLMCMGCQLAQGYAIAKPMPAGQVVGWARSFSIPAELMGNHGPEADSRRMQLQLFLHFLELEFASAQCYLSQTQIMETPWPAKFDNDSHCDFWLKKAANTQVIDKTFHLRLQNHYSQFISAIFNVMTLYKCGDKAASAAVFKYVEQSYATVLTLVTEQLRKLEQR